MLFRTMKGWSKMGLVNYTFFSEVLREQVNVSVILPTYNPWGSGCTMEEFYKEDKKFKTLYVLHGGSDDCTLYYRHTSIERYGQEGGFAVVMPEVKNSFYCNMKYGQDYFDYISKELPRVMESVFPLSNQREDHYVVGNSMGSHGAIKWVLNCPEFFNAAAGMSGVGDVEEMGFFHGRAVGPALEAFGSAEDYRGSNNDLKYLSNELVHSHIDLPRLFSCCGTEDPYYEGTVLYKQYLDQIGLPLIFEEGPGGHTWDFWDKWLGRIIDWMGITKDMNREEDK